MKNEAFKQFHFIEELDTDTPTVELGRYASHTLLTDPRRMVFMLARYKFVSKLLAGKPNVMEVGCSDGFGSNIVKQTVQNLIITDFDKRMVDEAKKSRFNKDIIIQQFNFMHSEYKTKQDAIFLLDVLEHIEPSDEDQFLKNISASLSKHGVCILGMPSLESQTYASASSKEGHVNCKSGSDFLQFTNKYFENSFLFSMNDEVVHTGFEKMAHYLLCVGVSPKLDGRT